jgi:RimJ/RimL family protein N-acetyltransferase
MSTPALAPSEGGCSRAAGRLSGVSHEVTLRPLAEDDLPLLHRLTSDPAVAGEHEWFGWRNPRDFPRRWAEDGLLGDDGGVVMVMRGSDRIGVMSWRKVPTSPGSHCWEIGISLVPEARGQGFGTRAQRMLVEYLFAHTHVNRIQAGTEITNVAEQRALQKAGFTREGVLRGSGYRDGQWRDGVLYSILRADVTGSSS